MISLMITIPILIPFPVSISISSSINVLLQSLVFIWIAKLLLFHGRKSAAKLSSFSKTMERDDISDFALSDDVLVEVLCWLPLKQLIKCKSVSKSWNSLISDVCIPAITSSSFHGLFVSPSPTSGVGWDFTSITGRDKKIHDSSFVKSCVSNFPSMVQNMSILDSYNGQLLLLDKISQTLYISNPCTQQCITLTSPPKRSMPISAALTSDLHMSVVYVRRWPLRILSYSLHDQKWTEQRGGHLSLETSILAARWIFRPVFCDGCLYVLSKSGHLLQFDVNKVTARAIQLPQFVEGMRTFGCMGLSQGHFHYARYDIDEFRIFIWMLDGHNLTLKRTISLLPLLRYSNPGFSGRLSKMDAYAFHPSSDIIFFGNNVGIFSYDLCRKKFDCVCRVRRNSSMRIDKFLVFPFSQNVASLWNYSGNTKKEPKGCEGSIKVGDNEDELVHQ